MIGKYEVVLSKDNHPILKSGWIYHKDSMIETVRRFSECLREGEDIRIVQPKFLKNGRLDPFRSL